MGYTEAMAAAGANPWLMGAGVVLDLGGQLFGKKKGPPPEELLHLPPELQNEWIATMMERLRGEGGYGQQQRALAMKQSRDSIRRSFWNARIAARKRFAGGGNLGTPDMTGFMQRLNLGEMGAESGAARDIALESMTQANQGQSEALGQLGQMYGQRRIEVMRPEEKPQFERYMGARGQWRY